MWLLYAFITVGGAVLVGGAGALVGAIFGEAGAALGGALGALIGALMGAFFSGRTFKG